MEIQFAAEHHIDELHQLCQEMHQESFYRDIPLNHEKLKNFLLRHISSDESLFLVVETEGGIVGMFVAALNYFFFSDEMLSQDLIYFIKKKERGTSAARRIAVRYIEWCKQKGVKEACLTTTTGINSDKMCLFYERFGFKKVGYVNKLKFQ